MAKYIKVVYENGVLKPLSPGGEEGRKEGINGFLI